VQQTIHHVIADEGARGLRHRRRDPLLRSALTIALIGSVLKHAAGRRRRSARRSAAGLYCRDPRIIDVDRHTFDGDIDATARLANRQGRTDRSSSAAFSAVSASPNTQGSCRAATGCPR
jgi:hypothetical protein